MAVSLDGTTLVSAGSGPDGAVRVWDLPTGQAGRPLAGPTEGHVAVSPDGKRVAVGRAAVLVFDAASGLKLFDLKGHTHGTMHMTFAPDGKRLATSSRDNTIRLWDLGTGWKSCCAPATRSG